MHPAQQLDQLFRPRRRQPRQRLVAGLVRDIQDAAEDRARLVGQEQAAGAPVGRVRAPLDPAVLFHAVDLPHQRHRPDFEQIGEAGLVDALVAGEIAEGPALRPGQAEATAVLVEAAPEQARDIVDEKPETAVEIQCPNPEIER